MRHHVGDIQRFTTGIANLVKAAHYYPHVQAIAELDGSRVVIDGKTFTNFATNSYLGLGQHPRIIEAAKKALMKFGCGTGGSSLTVGTQILHQQLSERIARFKHAEAAVVLSAGYLANEGIIPALTGVTLKGVAQMLGGGAELPSFEVFSDELIHASMLDGLAVATSQIFKGGIKLSKFANRDMAELEKLLVSSDAQHKLIIVDGVFSLHGRLAPLAEIVALARKYGAEIYVDDAHGLGVFGPTGRGIAEAQGVEEEIDFPMGTLSKAMCACGGYITGSADFCDYLRVGVRSFMFQTSMAPATAAGLIEAFNVIEDEPWRREKVQSLSAYVRDQLTAMRFDILGSESQIVPICFQTSDNAKMAAAKLQEVGIFAPPYYYPAVRPEEAMVRVNITADHSRGDVDTLLEVVSQIGRELAVI